VHSHGGLTAYFLGERVPQDDPLSLIRQVTRPHFQFSEEGIFPFCFGFVSYFCMIVMSHIDTILVVLSIVDPIESLMYGEPDDREGWVRIFLLFIPYDPPTLALSQGLIYPIPTTQPK
jgi:hypothetical protein